MSAFSLYSHTVSALPAQPPADVVLAWDAGFSTPEDRVLVAGEALMPLCAPGYEADHAETLKGPVAGWGGLTFLAFAPPGEGRASWNPWFAAAGRPASKPRFEEFDIYTYALDAAVCRSWPRARLAPPGGTARRDRGLGRAGRRLRGNTQALQCGSDGDRSA